MTPGRRPIEMNNQGQVQIKVCPITGSCPFPESMQSLQKSQWPMGIFCGLMKLNIPTFLRQGKTSLFDLGVKSNMSRFPQWFRAKRPTGPGCSGVDALSPDDLRWPLHLLILTCRCHRARFLLLAH